ncbi:hypothetical protein C0991_000378, partial [Blastosporella zonata]
ISGDARARLNAVLVISPLAQLFIGQVLGTAVGTNIFVKYGWRASAALGLAFYGWQFGILLLRGPHCARYTWFGYQGGLEYRKVVPATLSADEEAVGKENTTPTTEHGGGVVEEK